MIRLFRSGRINADALPVFSDAFEFDRAGDAGEESVISTLFDIRTRHDLRAALAIKDGTGGDDLPIADLGAKATTGGIAAVLRRTNTLLGSEEFKIENKFHDVTSFL